MAKVSLKLMLEAMESAGDLIDNYIHRQTGKIVMVSEDDIAALKHGIENAPGELKGSGTFMATINTVPTIRHHFKPMSLILPSAA